MKAVKFIIPLAVLAMLAACGGGKSNSGAGDYVIVRLNDWQRLNLKDSIEEIWETDVVRSNITTYTTFNRQGYITEKGLVENGQKKPREIRRYDSENNLADIKTLTAMFGSLLQEDAGYEMQFFDKTGRLTKALRVSHSPQGRERTDSTLYRYEISGRRETLSVNGKLRETVEDDKYRNILTRLTYRADGKENTLEEFEYTYDNTGNITVKIAYATMHYPLKEDFRKEYRDMEKTEFTYDENSRPVKQLRTKREAMPNENGKVEFQDRPLGTVTVVYDWAGNNTASDLYMFEYDRHSNWYLKWERQRSKNLLCEQRSCKHFGAADFENPREFDEEEYYEEE